MAQHLKRTRFDTATYTYPPNTTPLLTIPKDMSLHILLHLDVEELCLHCAVSGYSKYLALSALKLVKKATVSYGLRGREEHDVNLLSVLGRQCTRLTNLTLLGTGRYSRPHSYPVKDCLRAALQMIPTVQIHAINLHLEAFQVIRELKVPVVEITEEDDHTNDLTHTYSTLKYVSVTKTCFKNRGLLEKCPKLEALNISVRDDFNLMELTKCPNLRSVSINSDRLIYTRVSPFTFAMITECVLRSESLRLEMIVKCMPNLRILGVGLIESDLKCLSSLKRLGCLSIDVPNGGLGAIFRSCHQLEVLHVYFANRHTDPLLDGLGLKLETVCSVERLYIVCLSSYPPRSDFINAIRILEKIAPKLSVIKFNGETVKGSGGPDYNRYATPPTPWFENIFSRTSMFF